MSKVEIIPVEYGKSVLPESMIFQNGSDKKTRPIVFKIYLIKTKQKMILVDAGCVTMPGFDMTDYIGPIKALENIGVMPNDITDVIITHAHHDHIECANYFKDANIYIQEDEYTNGKDYLKDNTKIKIFQDIVSICDNVKAVKIGGHSKGSCIVKIDAADKTVVISGDECYLRECLQKQIPTESTCCLEKSVGFIKEYASDKYDVLLCHDK